MTLFRFRRWAGRPWLIVLAVLSGPGAAPSRASDPGAVLGPLADQVSPGQSGAWTVGESAGGLLLSNPAAPGAVRFYSTDWRGDLAAGRSVGVKVTAKGNGKGPLSGAGLVLMVSDGDPRWVAWVVTPDGRIAGYTRRSAELKLFSSTPIPGGPHPDGDLLQVNQKGDTAQVLVNGRFVAEMKPAGGVVPTAALPVGILALGTGDFTFDRFAFGPLVVPAKAGNDDTVPIAGGNDDTVPIPGPDASKPPPDAPKPVGPPKVVTVDVPSLGPLGKGVRLGPTNDWTRSIEDGRLIYVHDKDDGKTFWRTIRWAGTTIEGRSAGVEVEVRGTPPQAGAGLAFGFRDNGERMLVLLVGADDKIRLHSVTGKGSDLIETFDPPRRDDPDGRHRLKVSQTGDTTALYADGKLLKTFDKDALDASGDVGLIVQGIGRFAFRDFAFGPAVAPPSPPPPGPPATPRVRVPLKSFSPDAFGALFGIMAHEFGHFMVGDLKIPSTGPEEDVADEFAAMVFIDNFKDTPQVTMAMATGMAKLWWFMAEEKGGDATPFYDEHAPNRTRFAKIVCMLYGASPDNFGQLMDAAGIPDRTKQRCREDEPRRHAAWDTLLKPFRRRGISPSIPGVLDPATPGHKIEVVYEETKNPALRAFAEEIRDSGVFDAIADGITKLYVLPRDTKLVFRDCGRKNCFYSPDDGSVTMCWEMIDFVLDQFRKHGQSPNPTPTPVSDGGGAPGPASPTDAGSGSLTPEQFLAGRWRSRTFTGGVAEDALIELGPQGTYRSQVQAQTQQGVMMLNVQGQWSVRRVTGTSLRLTFSPQRWYPTQFCQQGHCKPIPLTTELYDLEIVDKNTVRTDRGTATRIP